MKQKNHLLKHLSNLHLVAICIILSSFFISCKTGNDRVVILYGQELEQVKEIAKKANKPFCIVLSRPDCPPCEHFVQELGDRYENLTSKAIFNIINVSQPEHQWYLHWLCLGASPTTLVFSPKGELKAVVSGVKAAAVQCIESSILGDVECAEYFFEKHFSARGDVMQTLNALLSCKQNFCCWGEFVILR
jgi:hypothetical protein